MAVKNSSTRNIASGAIRKGHMPMPQGKMKRSHGITNGGGKHKTLKNASGAVGKCRTFDSTLEKPPVNINKSTY